MTPTLIEHQLRTFLLRLAGLLCAGTIVELLLAKHYGDAVQLIPFALCGLGLLAVLAGLRYPRRMVLWLLRGIMGILGLGSAFGIYEHVSTNAAFALEIRPGSSGIDLLLQVVTGAAPLLAPGILALAAVLALAGTYGHPALRRADPQPMLAARTSERA